MLLTLLFIPVLAIFNLLRPEGGFSLVVLRGSRRGYESLGARDEGTKPKTLVAAHQRDMLYTTLGFAILSLIQTLFIMLLFNNNTSQYQFDF